MTRIVLDTNILVSGTFWTGASYRILKLVDEGRLSLFLSKALVKEYAEVVERGEILEKTTEAQHRAGIAAVQRLLLKAAVVEPSVRVNAVKEDPADNRVLEAAVAAKAEFVVTNDRHLLRLGEYQGIRILAPEEFLGQHS